MNTYDSYKDSSIQWIGEIPEHWEIVKIKYMPSNKPLSFIDGDWIESKDIIFDEGIRYITTGNIGEGKYKEQGSSCISEETFLKLNCTEVFPGDLLISRLNKPIGRSCIVPDLGNRIVTSVDNVIFRPKEKYLKGYLNFLMNNSKYSDYTELIARGATMQRISRGLLAEIKLPVPPLPEQTAIANYLDTKTTETDQIIADKVALINLYEEEKKALINEAVTKGVPFFSPFRGGREGAFKPSGIDWLGDVPEHWEVKKLKYILSIRSGESIGTDDVSDEFSIPVYGGNGIMGYTYKSNSHGKELIIGRVGAYCGNIYISEVEKWISDNALRVQSYHNWEFTYYFLKALDLNKYASQNAQPLITGTLVKDQYISLPPLDEQTAIVHHIETETTKVNDKINLIKQEIELLKEYRQALIFEAVTGKIRVH
jgi:type I restriction enzyme, S subunit